MTQHYYKTTTGWEPCSIRTYEAMRVFHVPVHIGRFPPGPTLERDMSKADNRITRWRGRGAA